MASAPAESCKQCLTCVWPVVHWSLWLILPIACLSQAPGWAIDTKVDTRFQPCLQGMPGLGRVFFWGGHTNVHKLLEPRVGDGPCYDLTRPAGQEVSLDGRNLERCALQARGRAPGSRSSCCEGDEFGAAGEEGREGGAEGGEGAKRPWRGRATCTSSYSSEGTSEASGGRTGL